MRVYIALAGHASRSRHSPVFPVASLPADERSEAIERFPPERVNRKRGLNNA